MEQNIVSDSYNCSNGIKQGGVLSPALFCVYMDELLRRLEASNVGCHIGHQFMGAFSYADDLSLLAPSLKAAQLMLEICEDHAMYDMYEYDIIFNST